MYETAGLLASVVHFCMPMSILESNLLQNMFLPNVTRFFTATGISSSIRGLPPVDALRRQGLPGRILVARHGTSKLPDSFNCALKRFSASAAASTFIIVAIIPLLRNGSPVLSRVYGVSSVLHSARDFSAILSFLTGVFSTRFLALLIKNQSHD